MNGASWQFVEVRDMSSARDLCCMSSLPSVQSLLSLPAAAVQQSGNVTKNYLKKQPRINHDKSVKCFGNSTHHALYWAICIRSLMPVDTFVTTTGSGCRVQHCSVLFKLAGPICDFQSEEVMWSCTILIGLSAHMSAKWLRASVQSH